MTEPAKLSVGVVLSPRPWASRLHAYATDHVADLEVIQVRDQRAALESGVAILVVDETTPWLNAALVDRAERAGVTVVGVWDPSEPDGEARLADLQIVHRMAATLEPANALYLVQRLRPSAPDGFDQLVAGLSDEMPAFGSSGAIVAVGGPPGSGSREIGIGLAASLSASKSTLLVDANEAPLGSRVDSVLASTRIWRRHPMRCAATVSPGFARRPLRVRAPRCRSRRSLGCRPPRSGIA
ncbi:MAG: hypothetical protein R2705_08995 [Ilumatobacteraceae bacterium]